MQSMIIDSHSFIPNEVARYQE